MDQFQSRNDSLSKNIETTCCQTNEANVVLKGELRHVFADRDMLVAFMGNSVEEHNNNQVSTKSLKSANNHQ